MDLCSGRAHPRTLLEKEQSRAEWWETVGGTNFGAF
jgi:hypothetical protein